MDSSLLRVPVLIGLRLPYQLRWNYVIDHRIWFTDGLKVALWMSLVGLSVGCVIGLVLAFARSTGPRPIRWLVTGYVEIVRNVPLLLIVFIFYFGLPQA